MKKVEIHNLGLMDYQEAWDLQRSLFERTVDGKMAARDHGAAPPDNHLLFVEHPHVYTLGKSGDEQHLLLNDHMLQDKGAQFVKIDRGGDITYHGPGQQVVYPIFDLDQFFTDIHKYLRYLEEAVILTLKEWGLQGDRIDGLTGVWLGKGTYTPRKICAIGVRCSRWVTMHGIGFNVNTDLNYFQNIVPCGITDKAVTSMQQELGEPLDMELVRKSLLENLANLFDFEIIATEQVG